jgi:predicted transcriptional regulator
MKRDHTTIKDRIDELGIKQRHVAKQCQIDHTTLNKIIKGVEKRIKKELVASIHNYLDKVKTRYGKDFPKEK